MPRRRRGRARAGRGRPGGCIASTPAWGRASPDRPSARPAGPRSGSPLRARLGGWLQGLLDRGARAAVPLRDGVAELGTALQDGAARRRYGARDEWSRVAREERQDPERALSDPRARRAREGRGDVPAHVLVGLAGPPLEPGERRVGIRAQELVTDGERPEVAADVLVLFGERGLDEGEQRLRPLRRPPPRPGLRPDPRPRP